VRGKPAGTWSASRYDVVPPLHGGFWIGCASSYYLQRAVADELLLSSEGTVAAAVRRGQAAALAMSERRAGRIGPSCRVGAGVAVA
jgi:hypothetical protein